MACDDMVALPYPHMLAFAEGELIAALVVGKVCTQCKAMKPREQFSRRKYTRDGRRPECRECQRAYNCEYGRQRRVDPAYRKQHREYNQQLRTDPAYRERERESNRERSREYYHTPAGRETNRRATAKRRALERGAEATLTTEQWADTLDRHDFRCYVCGAPYGDWEHVRALSNGGAHVEGAVLPACQDCNRGPGGKHSRTLAEWLPSFLRELQEEYGAISPEADLDRLFADPAVQTALAFVSDPLPESEDT